MLVTKKFAPTNGANHQAGAIPITRPIAPDLDALAGWYSSGSRSRGSTITYAELLDHTSTLHVVSIRVMLRDPITRPATSAGFFVATPQMQRLINTARPNHEKGGGSLVPPLFDAVFPCSELGVTCSFCIFRNQTASVIAPTERSYQRSSRPASILASGLSLISIQSNMAEQSRSLTP